MLHCGMPKNGSGKAEQYPMTQPSTNGIGALADVLAIQQRDLAALVQAQTGMITGMADLIARCQSEMLKAMLSTATAAPWSDPPKDASAGIALVFDAIKNATLESSARSNALSETAALAGGKVSGVLNDRWLAALDEWKATMMAAAVPVAR